MAAQVEYVDSVNADAIENPAFDAGRFRGGRLAGPKDAWSMAFGCGNKSGGDQLADAATSQCPDIVVDEMILYALDMCGDRVLIVHAIFCRYLGDGVWEAELHGTCVV